MELNLFCEACQKPFYRPYLNKPKPRFCSQACYQKAHASPNAVCEICSKVFKAYSPKHRPNRFCSRQCYGTWLRQSGIRKGTNSPVYSRMDETCRICSQVFQIPRNYKGKRGFYCSKSCYQEALRQRFTGVSNPNYGHVNHKRPRLPRHIRRQVYERDDHTCLICHKQRKGLTAHHVLPWVLSQSHDVDLLITLCRSCHAKVHNGKLPLPMNLNLSPVR